MITEKVSKIFERLVVITLIILMVAVILLAVMELVVLLFSQALNSQTPPLLGIDNLLDIFGFFLLILIGVELVETLKAYLQEHVVHVEIVLEVALIAIARKVIILDLKETKSDALFAVAALVVALAIAYFLQKRGQNFLKP